METEEQFQQRWDAWDQECGRRMRALQAWYKEPVGEKPPHVIPPEPTRKED